MYLLAKVNEKVSVARNRNVVPKTPKISRRHRIFGNEKINIVEARLKNADTASFLAICILRLIKLIY
jgi:hypothetical protein